MTSPKVAPASVHEVLGRHMLADGYDMVLDLEKSHGRRLFDSRSGRFLLDMFSFFGTLPMGLNHPSLGDADFRAKLTRAALANPANSDIYTTEFAEFVQTFNRMAIPPYLKYAFFVAGGTLGVENALKAAMDWKVRRNFRKGSSVEKGHQIIHFKEAFHGRSGYTLSLTNTADPRKYQVLFEVRLAAHRQSRGPFPDHPGRGRPRRRRRAAGHRRDQARLRRAAR